MNTARDQSFKGPINKPMTGYPRQAIEALAHDPHAEMPSFTSAGMACVQMAVILHFQADRQ